VIWIWAATLNWRVERLVLAQPDGPESSDAVPWDGAEAARRWSERLLRQSPIPTDDVQGLLDRSLSERPLYAPTWLDQAALDLALGDPNAASRHLSIARELWPTRPRLLWAAALQQARLGPPDLVVSVLFDYWAVAPGDAFQTLALARRFEPDPRILVGAAERIWRTSASDPAVYQVGLMNFAARAKDPVLAAELWGRLDPKSRTSETLLFPYLQLLIGQGQQAVADAVWTDTIGPPTGLVNGDFTAAITPLGDDFRPGWATPGWRVTTRGDGFRVRLDESPDEPGLHALMIDFLGTHNVDFSQVSQVVRVRRGQRYRLTGSWSGESITTRSGVFIEMFTLNVTPVVRVATRPRWGTWAREPFELDIDLPEEALLVTVRVRRAATKALDHLVAGRVWIDSLTFEVVPEDPSEPAALGESPLGAERAPPS
jgi:hypothetical protein